MKKLYTLFLLAVFTLTGFAVKSQTTMEVENDKNARAVLASYYLDIPVNFESSAAEACVNLLVNAHRNNVTFPVLPMEKLSAADQDKIEKLQRELAALRNNPPTWDNLLAKEEAKLATKYAAPTAPIFAGDLGRADVKAPKNQVRRVGKDGSYKIVEESTANEKEQPMPIKQGKD
jgi:hypothetical protein